MFCDVGTRFTINENMYTDVNMSNADKYFVVTRTLNGANLQKMAMEKELNTAAEGGWEFVTMIVENFSNQIIYFFKQA